MTEFHLYLNLDGVNFLLILGSHFYKYNSTKGEVIKGSTAKVWTKCEPKEMKTTPVLPTQAATAKTTTTATTTQVTVPTTRPKHLAQMINCADRVQAIFYDETTENTYVINKNRVYVLEPNLGISFGPIPLENMFGGVERVDAAYINSESHLILFKDNQ